MWGALSDERTGLSFTVALSFSGLSPMRLVTIFYCLRFETSPLSPPTTRRATVEVFDPASTRGATLSNSVKVKVKVKVTLRLTVGQSVSLGVEPHLGLMTRYFLLFDSYGLVFVGCPL
jgi:hypothetical protein